MRRVLILALFVIAGLAGTASPASQGLDAAGPGDLSRFLSDCVARGDVPGVVVLVTTADRVLYHEAFGQSNVAQGTPMRKDAIVRVASMVKALTSTAVMMLVEEGRVGLDDEIGRYLPAFAKRDVISRVDLAAGTYDTRPATRPITVRHLLTHTSGIGYSWSDPGLALAEKQTGRTSEVDLPLVNDPGEQWTYGASPKVLGDLVEKLTGQPIDAFLAARVFRPLGMRDTGWSVAEADAARVPTVHQRTEGRLVETQNPAKLSGEPRGDGRLFSTAPDYGRFLQMIIGRGRFAGTQLLQPETVFAMARNQMGSVKVRLQPVVRTSYSRPYPSGAGEDEWGLGFQIAAPAKPDPGLRRPGSLSWAGIDNTFFWIDPRSGIGVVVLMQLLPFYDEAALGVLRGVESRVYRHLAAAPPVAWPRVFLAGDSTMADKPLDMPERGWGMALPAFFADAGMVRNHAMNGRSTKSFIDEGRWQAIVDELRGGDFVIVQFGHNDEKTADPKRGTDPTTTFPENLRRFVRDVRGRGATPILATPVSRRKFDPAGTLTPTHGAYPDAVRRVAADEKVALLDLEKVTAAWLQAAGDEPSKRFFMWIDKGTWPRLPDGSRDDTHFVAAGAEKVAAMAVAAMREQRLGLAKWLR